MNTLPKTSSSMGPLHALEWPEIKALAKASGFRLVDAKASADGKGFYPAKSGGGYVVDMVACAECYQVVRGKPAYHGTVAYKP